MIDVIPYDEVMAGMMGNVSDDEIDNAIVECNRIASALGLGRKVEQLVTFPEQELEGEELYIDSPTDVGFRFEKDLRMPSKEVTASLFDNGNFKVVMQNVYGTKFYWFSNEGFAEEFVNIIRDAMEDY